jgi:hypothetical protein
MRAHLTLQSRESNPIRNRERSGPRFIRGLSPGRNAFIAGNMPAPPRAASRADLAALRFSISSGCSPKLAEHSRVVTIPRFRVSHASRFLHKRPAQQREERATKCRTRSFNTSQRRHRSYDTQASRDMRRARTVLFGDPPCWSHVCISLPEIRPARPGSARMGPRARRTDHRDRSYRHVACPIDCGCGAQAGVCRAEELHH